MTRGQITGARVERATPTQDGWMAVVVIGGRERVSITTPRLLDEGQSVVVERLSDGRWRYLVPEGSR